MKPDATMGREGHSLEQDRPLESDLPPVPPNLDALAFKVNIPSKYWVHFTAQNTGHLYRMQHAEKEKLERGGADDPVASAAQEMMAQTMERINAHPVQLTINGRELDMTQGELRNVMSDRLDELRQRKEQLERNGGSQDEIMAIEGLISDYEPLVERLQTGEADEETFRQIEQLAQEDPVLAAQLQTYDQQASHVYGTRSTSFASEVFEADDGDRLSSQSDFAMAADPSAIEPETAPDAPGPQQPNVEQTLSSMGF